MPQKLKPLITDKKTITGDDVLDFLQENPNFLLERGNTDWLFHPPSDNKIVNINHTITRRAQDALKRNQAIRTQIIDISAANHHSQKRVQQLALQILATESVNEILHLVRFTLPETLNVAAATMIVANHLSMHNSPHVVSVEKGYLGKLTQHQETSLGQPFGLQLEMFRPILSEQPKSVAFVFLPPISPDQNHDMLLAIAGKDSDSFTDTQGTDYLKFIASMLAVALAARPH